MSEEKKDAEELVEMTHGGETTMVYPEVAEFFRKREAARAQFDLATAKAEAEYHRVRDAAYVAHLEAGGSRYEFNDPGVRAAEGARQEAIRTAEERFSDYTQGPRYHGNTRRRQRGNPSSYEELYNATERPLIKWILDNCVDEEHNMLIILRHLPNTPEELWRIAKNDYEMCRVFDVFFEQAEAEGLISGERSPAYRELAALRNWVRRNWGAHIVPSFMTHLAPALKALQADYDKRLAEAKAEWQKLDEARAENAMHNRSETQRAVQERRRAAKGTATALAEEEAKPAVAAASTARMSVQ